MQNSNHILALIPRPSNKATPWLESRSNEASHGLHWQISIQTLDGNFLTVSCQLRTPF